jgi:hypothetical protein
LDGHAVTARHRAAALAFAAMSCAAAAEDELPGRWYLQVDNDVVFVTDRWYSSGVRVANAWAKDGHETEIGLLHEVYVPEQRNWEPGHADRSPTARLLLYGARHHRDPTRFDTWEAQLGVRGPAALGREITEFVHRAIPSEDVAWSRQLPNRVDVSVVAAQSRWLGPLRVHYGGVLGTQLVFAHAGVELRYGPGSRDIDFQAMRFAATPPFAARTDGLGWSVFGGASARAIAYNDMIGPNYDPGAADIHMKRSIARIAGGAAWTFARGSITFALVQDTREFDEQRRPQRFGSLGLHWAF